MNHSSSTRRVAAATVGMLLALAPLPAHAAPAAGERRAGLEVDTSAAGEAARVLARRLEERGAVVLRDAGILPREGAHDPQIRVAVSEVSGDEPGYRYTVELDTSEPWTKADVCSLCTESEIVQAVETAITIAASRVPEPAPPPEASTPSTAEPAPVTTPTSSSPPPTKDRPPLTTKGKIGIGLLAGGVVIAGIGTGLAAAPPKTKPGNPLEQTTTRPPGYALVGIGVATLVAGAVLLALDRAHGEGRRAALVPVPTRTGAHLALTVAF